MTAISPGHSRRVDATPLLACSVVRLAAFALLSLAAAAFAVTAQASPGGTSAHHPQGYLGIEFRDAGQDVSPAVERLRTQRGSVEILMVDHDGPAGHAGLEAHDIIVQMNGKVVEHSNDLRKRIAAMAPGRIVSLTIIRMGQMMTLNAMLADREEMERRAWLDASELPAPPPDDSSFADSSFAGSDPTAAASNAPPGSSTRVKSQSFLSSVLHQTPYTGATLEPLGAQLAGVFGAPADIGLLVHAVTAYSPAWQCGLRAGDVVLRLNGTSLRTDSDWLKQVRLARGNALRLDILRDRHPQALTLQPDLKRHSLLVWPDFGWR
jgi:serine protease Do